ncbi:hypothetical protein [Fodinibius sp. Rm-B-1B1-1]|uniref:hypothetical protein n=1 Tax=Fodinibius alkaliphilus TaxID=3140241 RepID=UPI00315B2DBE
MSIFEDINFEERARNLTLPEFDQQLLSYPLILKQFDGVYNIEPEYIILGVELIKGWLNLPQESFNYDSEDLEFMVNKFNGAFNENISFQELTDLALYFGNFEATTAMLHFLNPYSYPIHSPEIDKVLYKKTATTLKWEEQYLWQFIEACQSFSSYDYGMSTQIENTVSDRLTEAGYDYKVDKMRAIEMCLIYGDD